MPKWGKIGAPHSAKRKQWLARIRPRSGYGGSAGMGSPARMRERFLATLPPKPRRKTTRRRRR